MVNAIRYYINADESVRLQSAAGTKCASPLVSNWSGKSGINCNNVNPKSFKNHGVHKNTNIGGNGMQLYF